MALGVHGGRPGLSAGRAGGRDAQPPTVLVQRMVRADQGGNPLALLTRHPECLVAIDLSSAQLHCLALQ